MTDLSLTAIIYRYRAETATLTANQREAEERGEDADLPVTYWPLIETIEKWERPATGLPEAIEALKLAIEDYEIGPTDRIPAMMKAAFAWMEAEYKRGSGQ